MNHSLRSCAGTREVTSPTAGQEELLDYSPAGESRTSCQSSLHAHARGSVEKAEAVRDNMGTMAHLRRLCMCAEKKGLRDTPIPVSAISHELPEERVSKEGDSYFVLYKFAWHKCVK